MTDVLIVFCIPIGLVIAFVMFINVVRPSDPEPTYSISDADFKEAREHGLFWSDVDNCWRANVSIGGEFPTHLWFGADFTPGDLEQLKKCRTDLTRMHMETPNAAATYNKWKKESYFSKRDRK